MKYMEKIEKLDIKEYKAYPLPQYKDTYDSKELRLEELAEKVNEIIEKINPHLITLPLL